jgi:HlyD family secretion protein
VNPQSSRKAALIAAGIGVAALLGWLVTSQGPLAPAKVTVAKVEKGPLVASTFGIGTVEARRGYALGPTVASRVLRVLVDQGDAVKAGQLVAELDPVDLNDRVASGELAADRAASTIRAAEAQLAEARSRAQVATSVERRYLELRAQGFVSQEASDAKVHEANAAKAGVDAAAAQLAVARRDHERAQADVAGVGKLRAQARLVSPVDGVVSARLVEPGTTVVAGQAVVQVIDPASLWVRARIDQAQSGGVRVGQQAEIVLRSDATRAYRGEVQRVDLVSDAVTEERIVNVGFAARPQALSVGDLVEVTIRVAELANIRSIPAAAVKRVGRQDGVWRVSGGRAAFRPVKVGITTLDGRSQILEGLDDGEEVVVHSEKALSPDASVKVVTAIVRPGP